MRALLIIGAATVAALVLPVSSASARDRPGFGSGSHSGGPEFVDGYRFDRRLQRGTDTMFVYDRGYQGDSSWRPESFNDWWHERPNRAYPAWMSRNRDCQRTWWDGSVLRC